MSDAFGDIVTEMDTLRFQDDDVAVITVARDASRDRIAAVMQGWAAMFPDIRAVVVPDGEGILPLSRLTDSELADIGLQRIPKD